MCVAWNQVTYWLAADSGIALLKKIMSIRCSQGKTKTVGSLEGDHLLMWCSFGVSISFIFSCNHLPANSYKGYKFETLSTLPSTWAETSRDFIESRESQVVNNKEQYCSIVRTGIGKAILCLGGEVDASKSPINISPSWVYRWVLKLNCNANHQYGTPSPKKKEAPSTGSSSKLRPRSATAAT